MPNRRVFLAVFTSAAALALFAFIQVSNSTTAAVVPSLRRLEADAEQNDPFAGAAFVAPVTKEVCAEGTKRTYVAWKKVCACFIYGETPSLISVNCSKWTLI
jgi:hypothetical protein